MKKSLLIAGLVLGGFAASADATLNVINSGATAVFDTDGTTKLDKTKGLFEVIYGGNILTPGGTAGVPFVAAGIFNAGVLTIPGANVGDNVSITINIWDSTTGATFAAASHTLSSTFMAGPLGGGATPPPKISNFTGGKLSAGSAVPEPSTYALAALGLGGLLFISRRK